ncbi:hypothetical protein CHUAL_008069 [Chamberlinius hualienensis]
MEKGQRLVLLLKTIDKEQNHFPTDEYSQELKKLNFEVVSVSTLSFEFCNLDQLRSCLYNANEYAGLVFTSTRSVEAVYKSCPDWYQTLLTYWQNLKTYVVGSATRQKAEELLNLKCVGEGTGSGEQLAHFIAKDKLEISKFLLHPTSNISRETLPRILQEEGIQIKSIFVYETKPHPELLSRLKEIYEKESKVEYVVFFSPSGVKSALPFFETMSASQHSYGKFVAIGPTTCDALVKSGLKCACTASTPSAKGVADAIFSLEQDL